MTQSGQGDESRLPAARPPAHEGVVLPADGSGPWIPGAPEEHVAPAGGQPWGQPWGPQQSAAPQPPQQQYGAPQPPQAPQYGTQQYGAPQPPPQQQYGGPQPQPGAPLPPAQPQPGAQQQYGAQPQQQAPQYGAQPPVQQQPQQQYGSQPAPPQPGSQQYGAPQPQAQPQPQSHAQPLPLPAEAPAGAPAADADATQYLPYVPPAGPGALPPENPADSTQFLGRQQNAAAGAPAGDADATRYLPPVPNGQGAPEAPSGAPYGIRPGAPEDRQPPAEFDNLFRADAAPPADPTQQMPPLNAQPPHQQYQQPPFGAAPQGRAARRNASQAGPPAPGGPVTSAAPSGAAPRRRNSPLVLIAAVVVGCSVLGLGAGALLSMGDGEKTDDKKPVAVASSPGGDASPQAAADPAKPQAESLDALLADSNDSRASVISAVQSIGTCKNLSKAASDLRAAAKQRSELVTRLKGLTIDKLPKHAELSASLTTAWKASEAADNHYAAWADQVAGKKGCKKGHAQSTPQKQAGNRESGKASQAKKEAVGMWNDIAKRYGLTERDATQL
ncbi:hypothetical protein J7E96_07005 [Streptomyces sp. ISL-96]|uniref:hypothetical protein n=1 Tax=Streptomyces sp. ISL-96 TaxID=2819191 RepID=UPI001BEC958E|nr:hypothetical protein [Streptomyces sp. ISL-96]MBT2488275.1 hypothetical protein [Streptomyces sp. ISL-96]